MLLMRRREEADGERRMIGSGRRPAFLSRDASVVVPFMSVDGWSFLRSFM